MKWTQEELERIVRADDLHVSPFREDGKTPGTPTWIWCVALEGELYVRAYSGRRSTWYQAAVAQKAGQIRAAGATHAVGFELADKRLDAQIDEAYQAKYAGSPYLNAMISSPSRQATIKILPRNR